MTLCSININNLLFSLDFYSMTYLQLTCNLHMFRDAASIRAHSLLDFHCDKTFVKFCQCRCWLYNSIFSCHLNGIKTSRPIEEVRVFSVHLIIIVKDIWIDLVIYFFCNNWISPSHVNRSLICIRIGIVFIIWL